MELKKAFEIFKNIPFPEDSFTNEELSDIHSEIALYDTSIAGNINTILSGKKNITVENDDTLNSKLNIFLKRDDLSLSDRRLAIKMNEYLKSIDDLIRAAKNHLLQKD